MRRMKMGTAKNEIGEGKSVCLWAKDKIVFLLPDTVRALCKRAQCKCKPVYQTGPKKLSLVNKVSNTPSSHPEQ